MLVLGLIIVAVLLLGAIGLALAMLGGTWFGTQLFPPPDETPSEKKGRDT
jgi:hypothetical protein